MKQNERNKLYVARCLLDGKMTIGEAAEILSLSERQVNKLNNGLAHFILQSITFKKKPPEEGASVAVSRRNDGKQNNWNYLMTPCQGKEKV
jgi:hypothetical protein